MNTHIKAATTFAPKSPKTQITTTLQRHSISHNLQKDLKTQPNKPDFALQDSNLFSHSLSKTSLSLNTIAIKKLNVKNRTLQRRKENKKHLSKNIKGQLIITNRTNKIINYNTYRDRQKQNLVKRKCSLPSNKSHKFIGKYSFTKKDMAGKGKVPIYYDGFLSWWSASRGILYLSFELTKGAEKHPVLGLDSKVKNNKKQTKKRQPQKQQLQRQLSSPTWRYKFPTSRSLKDLQGQFRVNAQNFISALEIAGARVTISATRRPKERAYIMHWAYRIAKENYSARRVPPMTGVNISWWHGNQANSRKAAKEMVQAYGIVHKPALNSNHIRGTAIDMNISWQGTLKIRNARRQLQIIKGKPSSGMNRTLWKVGNSYKVIKHKEDPPHWSHNGR